jgi:hypothetical protein
MPAESTRCWLHGRKLKIGCIQCVPAGVSHRVAFVTTFMMLKFTISACLRAFHHFGQLPVSHGLCSLRDLCAMTLKMLEFVTNGLSLPTIFQTKSRHSIHMYTCSLHCGTVIVVYWPFACNVKPAGVLARSAHPVHAFMLYGHACCLDRLRYLVKMSRTVVLDGCVMQYFRKVLVYRPCVHSPSAVSTSSDH